MHSEHSSVSQSLNQSVGVTASHFEWSAFDRLISPHNATLRRRRSLFVVVVVRRCRRSLSSFAVVVVIVLAGLGCLYVTQFFVYTFRDLIGSTSHLVDLLNNKTDSEFRNYTMWQVSMNVLKGSGSNPFLQKDLVIFTIAGPAVCFLFSLVSAVVPMPRSVHWFVAKLAGLGFTFSGIEVLAFGLLLTTVILPAQSAGLIQIGGSAPYWWCLAMDHVYVTERGACVRSALLRPMCSRFYSLLCRRALGTVSATNPASTKR